MAGVGGCVSELQNGKGSWDGVEGDGSSESAGLVVGKKNGG